MRTYQVWDSMNNQGYIVKARDALEALALVMWENDVAHSDYLHVYQIS